MSEITQVLSLNMKRLRESRGWRQADLAEKMGVSTQTVANYESGRRWPEIDYIKEMAKAFGVAEAELFRDPNFKPEFETVLLEFGRLLAQANPLTVKHALQILAIGQPDVQEPAAQRRTGTRKA